MCKAPYLLIMTARSARRAGNLDVIMSASTLSDHNERVWARSLAAFNYRNTGGLIEGEIAILERLGDKVAQARFLDIGIGAGRTTGALQDKVARYSGGDYSPAMVKLARKRFPNADIDVADARDLKAHQDGSFDIALFSFNGIDSLAHEDRLQVLAAVKRVLAPGGVFIFCSHNRAWTCHKPGSLAKMMLTLNPKQFVKGAGLYVICNINHMRMRGKERHEEEYAILNDSGEEYRLMQYYIRAEDQVKQLERAGFADIEVCATSGQRIEPKDASPSDFMLYYIARKP
jgi:ubiquinone/menaquinone biosynthesis C-methylase UbiE